MFKLDKSFVNKYADKPVPFGPLGEVTFLRTYSRKRTDGSKEQWVDVCERVVNWSIQNIERHCKENNLPFHENSWHARGRMMFDFMFEMKWMPPGRGLWASGTKALERGSGALQNCCFVSTDDYDEDNPGEVYGFISEALMLGVGVGTDNSGAYKKQMVFQPNGDSIVHVVDDSREGWADSITALINSHLLRNQRPVVFDYTQVRPAGTPIKGFGGIASGPGPLKELHDTARFLLEKHAGQILDTIIIADIVNIIGRCVVSGNVRRSAEIFLAPADDLAIRDLKNPAVFPDREAWSWLSNNSIVADSNTVFDQSLIERIVQNGEPGVIFLDNFRNAGRSIDEAEGQDFRIRGVNPCAEQGLESREMCTLAETFISRCANLDEFIAACRCAFTYAKSVTLMPTQWEKTNAVMARNRRIGIGVSGVTDFFDNFGMDEDILEEWLDPAYQLLEMLDVQLSEDLGVRESIKLTTVKPSGTISLLAGASPGVHWTPAGEFYLRAVRFGDDDPVLGIVKEAGYRTEPDEYSANTTVAYFPIQSEALRSEEDVTAEEKFRLAQVLQAYWSDNGVSLTISFDPDQEKHKLLDILEEAKTSLKGMSFLPMSKHSYKQPPFQTISESTYRVEMAGVKPLDFSPAYRADFGLADTQAERGCETDACDIKAFNADAAAQTSN